MSHVAVILTAVFMSLYCKREQHLWLDKDIGDAAVNCDRDINWTFWDAQSGNSVCIALGKCFVKFSFVCFGGFFKELNVKINYFLNLNK